MQDEKFDDEMNQQMLDWLGRGMDANGNFPEVHTPDEIVLTEEDHQFLRQLKIAISPDQRARRFAH